MNTTLCSLADCPETLRDDQIDQFRREGYLAFAKVISPADVRRASEALERITREMVADETSVYSPPHTAGSNQSGASYKRCDSRSFMQLEPGFDPVGQATSEVERRVRKYMWFCEEDPVFREMVGDGSRLRGVVESVIGAAPILFQEMALVKPPLVGSEKPWHQDNAYFSVTPLDAVMGVWIALDDAGVENGCMHVIPGGHQIGGLKHHHGIDCEIDQSLLPVERAVPVPVPAGGAMFFYGMLPHETPANRSPKRRRALQFHFRGAATRFLDDERYDEVFVDRSGQPASCRAASRLGF